MGSLPQGWSYAGSEVQSGRVRFWFNSDRVGPHAIEVLMTGECDVSGASEVSLAAPPPGLRRYEEASVSHPGTSVSYFVFPGACVTYRFSFTRHEAPRLYAEADRALGFTPRSLYVDSLRQHSRITLCGTGAPPCPG